MTISYQFSTTERKEVQELAKAEKIDCVLTYASDPAAAVAYATEKFHLPENSLRATEILGNKARFWDFLRKMETPTPQAVILKAEDCADPEKRADAGASDDAVELSELKSRYSK